MHLLSTKVLLGNVHIGVFNTNLCFIENHPATFPFIVIVFTYQSLCSTIHLLALL